MKLGYKNEFGQTPYWYGNVPTTDGKVENKKFVRVIAGLVQGRLERQPAALVVFGELFRAFGQIDLTALAAKVGQWSEIETALKQFYADMKFDQIVTEAEDTRTILWRIPELVRVLSWEAPAIAVTETGRQNVVTLKKEGRLRFDIIEPAINVEPSQGAKAIQCVVAHCLESKALYKPEKKGGLNFQSLAGSEGL